MASAVQTRRCVVCGAVTQEGPLCPEHRDPEAAHWQELKDASEIEYADVTKLSIDERFQVPLDHTRVNRIKRKFDQNLVGVLTISQRDNGERVILDGQHRWTALMELGYRHVKAEVFRGLTLQQEAWIFAERNGRRATPNRRYIWRALTVAQEERHVKAQSILATFGLRAAVTREDARETNSIGAARVLEQLYDMGMLASTLEVVTGAWPAQKSALSAEALMGTAAFLKLHPEVSARELISSLGQVKIGELVARSSMIQQSSRDRRKWAAFYAALVGQYNYKRQYRLSTKVVPSAAPNAWAVNR